MARELTPKQRKWLDAYIETGNATEAARRAGYAGNDVTLASIGYQNFRKLQIPVGDLLDQMGLDDGALVAKMREGLEAETVVTAKFEGQITDERTYVDFATRLHYLDMVWKLKGKYPSAKMEHSGAIQQQISIVEVVKEQETDGEDPSGAEWQPIEI